MMLKKGLIHVYSGPLTNNDMNLFPIGSHMHCNLVERIIQAGGK